MAKLQSNALTLPRLSYRKFYYVSSVFVFMEKKHRTTIGSYNVTCNSSSSFCSRVYYGPDVTNSSWRKEQRPHTIDYLALQQPEYSSMSNEDWSWNIEIPGQFKPGSEVDLHMSIFNYFIYSFTGGENWVFRKKLPFRARDFLNHYVLWSLCIMSKCWCIN